jgi:hypothetical protein
MNIVPLDSFITVKIQLLRSQSFKQIKTLLTNIESINYQQGRVFCSVITYDYVSSSPYLSTYNHVL